MAVSTFGEYLSKPNKSLNYFFCSTLRSLNANLHSVKGIKYDLMN